MKKALYLIIVLMLLLPACVSQVVEEEPNNLIDSTQSDPEAMIVTSTMVGEIDEAPSFTEQLAEILNRCKSREMSLSPNGEHLVILCEDKDLWTFDIRNGIIELTAQIELPMYVFRFKWSKDSSALALSTREGVHFFSPVEKKLTGYLESKHWFPVDVAWSNDNNSIAVSVPGGSLITPTDAFAKILSYPELEVLKELNYAGETPIGTFSILWNGELENFEFFLTAGELIHLDERGLTKLEFPILAPDFLSYMGWLPNNRFYVTGIVFEPQSTEYKIGIFEKLEKITEFTINDSFDESLYIGMLDLQESSSDIEFVALLSDGKIIAYNLDNKGVKPIWEIQRNGVDSSSKICLFENHNILVLMFGDGNFEIIPLDFNLVNGEG